MSPISRINRRSTVYLLALLIFLPGLAAAAGLDASLDRTRMAEGETVVLSLSAPGNSSGAPDATPLEQDFDLLNQTQSSRMNFTNGSVSSTREWQWVLSPKRSGKLQIPSLKLGALSSAPLTLEVLPAAQAAKLGEPRPIILEVEAQSKRPYVQGQVIYSVRVLHRVSLNQAKLSEPAAADAIVQQMGDEKHYTTYRDGRQYQVAEIRYAVFPQHSGKLEIEGPVLKAQVPVKGRHDRMFGGDPFGAMDSFFGRDPFADIGGIFGQTRPVQLHGRTITLDVQPQPAHAAGPWLPAESLDLSESWSPDPPVFRVGEPVTRTLAITAQGLSAAQLPDLQPPAPAGVKVYPDQPQSETRAQGDTLVSQKVLKSALVPPKAGKLTLPEVRLAWWDIKDGKQRVATLPARTVEVLPAAAGTVTAAPTPTAEVRPSLPPTERPVGAQTAAVPVAPLSVSVVGGDRISTLGDRLIRASGLPAGYLPWLALLLALAWLVSTVLWLRARGAARRPDVAESTKAPAAAPNPAKALGAVKSACNGGNPRAARQALLDWAAARWPEDPPRRIDILARRLGGDAAQALRELDRILYDAEATVWDGASAWQRIGPALDKVRQPARGGDVSPLPPLYPRAA